MFLVAIISKLKYNMCMTIEPKERKFFEQELVNEGYVGNFINRTFGEFFKHYGINIHSEKYEIYGTSKAKKMRAFWDVEEDINLVRRIMRDMLWSETGKDIPEFLLPLYENSKGVEKSYTPQNKKNLNRPSTALQAIKNLNHPSAADYAIQALENLYGPSPDSHETNKGVEKSDKPVNITNINTINNIETNNGNVITGNNNGNVITGNNNQTQTNNSIIGKLKIPFKLW